MASGRVPSTATTLHLSFKLPNLLGVTFADRLAAGCATIRERKLEITRGDDGAVAEAGNQSFSDL